ncbi:MAG: DUF4038 domain-containing protein, partial [Firmicutes bacterium]|nr:DUF4038 domain-containing protein [Bacillota bacterium]
VEIVLESNNTYDNPYTEIEVWVDLKGPGFDKRVYGFWDGGSVFKVRITAASPGTWSCISGSNQFDSGLNGKYSRFSAVEWTREELEENRLRHGFIRATPNGHAFMHADGTPFYLLADTWWSAPTFRLKWHDDDIERPVGPEMGFKDMVRYRKKQGYNGIAMIAAHPTWANDRYPSTLQMDDEYKTTIRAAWQEDGHGSSEDSGVVMPAKDMYNEGGRPFAFPGNVKGYEDVVPDFNRINPQYFMYMDRKVDYLNSQGFVAFIEIARRDVSEVWKRYGGWPDSYMRYMHYIFTRYQANNCILSPIHFDYPGYSIPSREYNEPANMLIDRYGYLPFGTLLGSNSAPSSLANFGGSGEAKWLSFHQLGNWREHDHYWYLTEIFNTRPSRPALNGEPYYPGFPDDNPETPSELANLYCRSGMYGSFLSGGLAGYMYGVEGLWGSNIEESAKYRLWDAIKFKSGEQAPHLMKFVMAMGARYQDLIPNSEMVTPNKFGNHMGYKGWAYCAATKEKDWLMLYFEKDCPRITVRGVTNDSRFRVKWFDPRKGEWFDDADIKYIESDQQCRMHIPEFPSNEDWGMSLVLEGHV